MTDEQKTDYDDGKDQLQTIDTKKPELDFKAPRTDSKLQTIKRQILSGRQVSDDLHPTLNLRDADAKIMDPKSANSALKHIISKKLKNQSNNQNVAEMPCNRSQMDMLVRRESPKLKDSKENNRYFTSNSRLKEKSKKKQSEFEYHESSEYQKARSQKQLFLNLMKAKSMYRSPTPQNKIMLIPPKEVLVGKQSPTTKMDLKHQFIMNFQNSDKHIFQTKSRTENNPKKQKLNLKSIDPIGAIESNSKPAKKVHIDLNRMQGSPSNVKDNYAIKPHLIKSQRNEGWTNLTSFWPESIEDLPKEEPKGKTGPNFLPIDEGTLQLLRKYETTDFSMKKRKEQQRAKKGQASKFKLQLVDPLTEPPKKSEEQFQDVRKVKLRQRTKSSLAKQITEKPSTHDTNAGFYSRSKRINLEEDNLIVEKLEIGKLNEPQTARLINQSFNEYGSVTARNITARKPQLFNSMKKYEYKEDQNGKASRSPASKEDAFHNFMKKHNDNTDKKRPLQAQNSPFDRK